MSIPLSHWIVFVGVCAFVAWLNGRRDRLQTSAPRTNKEPAHPPAACGCAYRAGQWIACQQHRVVLLPPEGNWCGCCGRPCAEPWLWCDDCLFHVELAGEKPLHERTWYAQHGELCPFIEDDDDAAADVDIAPEGGAPAIHPLGHDVYSLDQLTKGERDLWDEICQRVPR